ncbi:hypothetical protein Tco_0499151 [Tanacetum coccineum]
MAKSLASHISSKVKSQSGAIKIGASANGEFESKPEKRKGRRKEVILVGEEERRKKRKTEERMEEGN